MVEAYRPLKLQESLKIAASGNCTILAGGTDLMVKKKRWSGLEPGFEGPVVIISEVSELKQIRNHYGYLEIGAACTLKEIIEDKNIPDYIKEVLSQMASPGIRNIATIGGNICNSSPAGDCLPLLYALDAVLILESYAERRQVLISDFITGPGKNLLRRGEILTNIRLPSRSFSCWTYRKIGTRKSTALSKLSFIGFTEKDKGSIQDIRMAFGAVAPTVVRSMELEKNIIEMSSQGELDMDKILMGYSELIRPIDDQRSTSCYRKIVSLRLLEEFLTNQL